MFLKSVVMDGFKCYSMRTVINNINRSFTAITGLNGSGKSNIIDAIVFALDLGTSKLMRVSSLRELINISRKECSVTLTFNNKDKALSPAGYEHYDVIEVTRSLSGDGKSKFKMNGHNCARSSVEMMCKSVGITSDFMVMQGRITKIINMKGSELRSMVEEVAGTRSYNVEKERAREELEKKEIKLREAREYLQRNISPFLNEMLREKKIYEENKDFESRKEILRKELENLERLKGDSELYAMTYELMETLSAYAGEKAELDGINAELSEMNDVSAAVDLVELKSRISEEMLRIEEWEEQKVLLEKLRVECSQRPVLSVLKYNKAQLLEKERVLSKEVGGNINGNRIEDLEQLKSKLHNLEVKSKYLWEELIGSSDIFITKPGGKKVSVGRLVSHAESDTANGLDSVLYDINEAVNYSVQNKSNVDKLSSEIATLKSKFIYPVISGVYGTVDENFDLVDVRYKESIFTILGGRAKFIICADDNSASEVLKLNDRRVSCIPLSKIVVNEQSTLNSKGISALSVIRYDPRYDKAYKYIFNNYYIFEDKSEAYECCYKHKVMCVTLDGTVYDPRGTLTGGKSHYKSEIVRMRDVLEKERQLVSMKGRILDEEQIGLLRTLASRIEEYKETKSERENAVVSIGMLEKICGAEPIDVKNELARIRMKIIEATREEGEMKVERQHREGMITRMREIEGKVEEDEIRRKQSEELVREYKRLVQEEEMKAKKRRSTADGGVEKRKEQLIKNTVKLSGKIKKKYEEIVINRKRMNKESTMNKNSIIDKENNPNNIIKHNSYFDDKTLKILNEFDIDPLELTRLNDNEVSLEDISRLDERIAGIKGELSVKRQRSTMDPGSFELLEKNAAVMKDIEGKIARLEQDKENIMASMSKLAELGVRENEKAFSHINENIQKFFGYFIKNAEISIGRDYEIKVKVGEWKNSTTELSGGQRSLIALCLIFSMLSYRTAPLYIFDEIDAALDLNYTQGIGDIIQREFKNSQFLVVSLKNNMFENANKIFRVFMQNGKPCIAESK